MKMLKRLLLLCLVFTIVSSTALAYNVDVLNYLNALPENISDDAFVTREMFAYSVSRILEPNRTYEAVDTVFDDVKSDNVYSGYIQNAENRDLMHGSGDGMFRPRDLVTLDQAAKVLVTALGYGVAATDKGGWSAGYAVIANSLKLNKDVTSQNGYITFGGLKQLLANVLSAKTPDENVYVSGDSYGMEISIPKDAELFAEKYLSLSLYTGVIKSFDAERNKADVMFTDVDDDSIYAEGSVHSFDVAGRISIREYENIPVEFVLYDNKEIISITLPANVEMHYGVVTSVNNEFDENAYYTNYLNVLTIDDIEYDFADDCIFSLNNKEYSGKLALMNKYVKIAEQNGEIVALSTWDLADGGAITKVDYSNIYYKVGFQERRIAQYGDYVDTLVIVDGKTSAVSQLKEGMVFSFYKNDDDATLVIIATEAKLYDVLHGVNTSDKTLSLGNISVECADEIYSTEDGVTFKQGYEYVLDYSNTEVEVALDIYGKAKYVYASDASASKNKFVGYLIGIAEGTGFKNTAVRVMNVEDSLGITSDHELKDNVKFGGSLTREGVFATAGAEDGSALYEITLTADGKIAEFNELHMYDGYGTATINPDSFIEDTQIYLNVDGKKLFLQMATKVICIYKDANDDFKVKHVPYSTIRGKYCSNVTMRFYGYEENSEIRFLTLAGDISTVEEYRKYGFLSKMTTGIDENDEIYYNVVIDGKKYKLDKDDAKGINANMYVSYTVSTFDEGRVRLGDRVDLSDDMENWIGRTNGNINVIGGVVESADERRVILDGDQYHYYVPGSVSFYSIDDRGNRTSRKYQDLQHGMEVAILRLGGNVYSVFYKE